MNENAKTGDLSGPPDTTRVAIGQYPSSRQAHDAGLAILAAKRPYWVQPDGDHFLLLVEQGDAEWLAREVRETEKRNRFWPPSPLELPLRPPETASSIWVGLLLVGFFVLQVRYPGMVPLGLNSSQAVWEQGEWWRVFTAVTLHDDLGHLAGNLVALPLFGFLCCRYLGVGLAWLTILLLAALSNTTNVLLHADREFLSLGASTAVFAALGLLAGMPAGLSFRTRQRRPRREWILPFAGAIVMFLWIGIGDYRTDIGGHLWSFLFGSVAALPLAYFQVSTRVSASIQIGLLGVAGFFLATCWWLAIYT